MSNQIKVLMVDDEPNILSGYRRTIGRSHNLVIAEGGEAGLLALKESNDFHVVVTDMRMPEMDGLEFLKKAKSLYPNLVYIMLTGNSDQETAINAINQGEIFRFLNKPCDKEILEHTLRAAKNQYDLIHAEANLLKNTLTGSIKLLIEAMVISDPEIAGIIKNVRENMRLICTGLGVTDWRITLAGSMFLIGGFIVPRTGKHDILSESYIESCAKPGANLLRHIPRLEEVSQIISTQRTVYELPSDLSVKSDQDCVAIGSQILRLAYDWCVQTCTLENNPMAGLAQVESITSSHDPRLIDAARSAHKVHQGTQPEQPKEVEMMVSIRNIREGMRTNQDINTSDGSLLIGVDQVVSQMMIERLRGFLRAGLVSGEVSMLVSDEPLKDCA